MSEDPPKSVGPAAPAVDIAAMWSTAYEDLRQLARSRLRASGPLTLLDTSGLVSDTYQRLVQQKNLRIESRSHFLAYCARVMRSVIIDLVREKQAERRGGDLARVTLNTSVGNISQPDEEPLQIDEALNGLAQVDPRLAQVVEMRYFGGYTETEVAEALNVTTRTVQRDWRKARVLLQSMLGDAR